MPSSDLTFREARRGDLPAIVALLADDHLGSARELLEDPLPRCYVEAFDTIERDPNHELLVATREGEVVATLQMTYTRRISHRGSWRATLESVRTRGTLRGQGIGRAFVTWAIERARARGCRLVHLDTHVSRTAAQRFYERLGFDSAHVGMQLDVSAGHGAAPSPGKAPAEPPERTR